MKDQIHAEITEALKAWSDFWRVQSEQLQLLRDGMSRPSPCPMSAEDVAVIKQLVVDIERLFRHMDYAVQNRPTGSNQAVIVAFARDSMWIALEFRELAEALDRAAEQMTLAPLSMHLSDTSALTHRVFKKAASIAADILEVSSKPIDDTIQTLESLRQLNESLATNRESLTVKQLAAQLDCSQQAVSKRIKRLLHDKWLDEPATKGKQLWAAHEVRIILENPPGKNKARQEEK